MKTPIIYLIGVFLLYKTGIDIITFGIWDFIIWDLILSYLCASKNRFFSI